MLQEPDTPGAYLRYHQFKVSGALFECPSRYGLIKPIGKGAYGLVCSAQDSVTNEKVAIKKVGGIFDNPLDARRTLREAAILRHLAGHANVVQLRDLFPPPSGPARYQDVYMVYELLDTDLHQVIRSPQPLEAPVVQYLLYQLLRGLKYIHSAGVLHRDLKPSNLLLNANCDLRICDFGLATAAGSGEPVTEYVVTRWYRPPELLLSCGAAGPGTDIWAAGCIFAEMLGRKPLFPGKDFLHQLNLICKVIGTPSAAEAASVPGDRAAQYLSSMPACPPASLASYFPAAPPAAIDLLSRMLRFDPGRRLSAEQALAHPYLASLHDPGDEPVCGSRFDPVGLGLAGDMPSPAVRARIYQEMVAFSPDLAFL